MQSPHIDIEQIARIKKLFLLNGTSYSDWAKEHQVNRAILYAVLSGKCRCHRGEAHKIAVLLGLKPQSTALLEEGLGSPPKVIGNDLASVMLKRDTQQA
jgi:gp16 family phage-associated protein